MQTIGERLEEARKRKGISIREAAEATKIRGDYLQKFESNQFDCNLAELYVRGFLRSYAQFLKLPADKIVNDFNNLGHGTRPRTPSREVYGRMDLSVAKSDEDDASQPEPAGAAQGEQSSPPRRAPGSFTRGGGGAMPSGPMIDPNLVIKGGLVLGVIVLVLFGIWIVKSLMGSGTSVANTKSGSQQNPAAQQPAQQANTLKPYVLRALNTVVISARRKNSDGSEGEVIYDNVMLNRNDTRTLSRPGVYFLTLSASENVELESDGIRTNLSVVDGKGFKILQTPESVAR